MEAYRNSMSDDSIAVKLIDVSKTYRFYPDKRRSLKEAFIHMVKGKRIKPICIKVLQNVSLDIQRGEVFGIIGENGVGKSTILKIISGILPPDNGEVLVNGSLASLLEIGLGFHPDLTGRENALLYGTIMGLRKKAINSKMSDIFDFADLRGYEDVQMKRYSSGMQMRLAFSVATMVNPDILLLDEIFSVGDQKFQEKSFEKICSFIENGKTVLLVSHDLTVIEEMCNRVMLIQRGGIVTLGETEDIVNLYRKQN